MKDSGIATFHVERIREDFPILKEKVYNKTLVYLDNAATTQKPISVINALVDYYTHYNANIHRGVHALSQRASEAFDHVRLLVRDFIHAKSEQEIIFVRGTTEAINLVASTYGRRNVKEGDEILISAMEHHSNIVPWQLLCEEKRASLKVIPMNDKGELVLDDLDSLLNPRTKIVSLVHTSNSLGTINPVKEVIQAAHRKGIPVMIDAAQAMVHQEIDVQQLDCDFLAFSGHKMLGPTGIGCLYGKLNLLEAMPPYQGGGEMIASVSFEKTDYNEVPFKFEAGTPNIADVIALGEAIRYLQAIDRNLAALHEENLMQHLSTRLQSIPGIRLIGTAAHKTSVCSFIIEGVNALDAGMMLDTKGIAVRTGHHCTEPIMDRLKIPGTIRASMTFYNTIAEMDKLADELRHVVDVFAPKFKAAVNG